MRRSRVRRGTAPGGWGRRPRPQWLRPPVPGRWIRRTSESRGRNWWCRPGDRQTSDSRMSSRGRRLLRRRWRGRDNASAAVPPPAFRRRGRLPSPGRIHPWFRKPRGVHSNWPAASRLRARFQRRSPGAAWARQGLTLFRDVLYCGFEDEEIGLAGASETNEGLVVILDGARHFLAILHLHADRRRVLNQLFEVFGFLERMFRRAAGFCTLL